MKNRWKEDPEFRAEKGLKHKRWREKNREHVNAYNRTYSTKWRKENLEKYRDYQRDYQRAYRARKKAAADTQP